jgi:hypothetical protein
VRSSAGEAQSLIVLEQSAPLPLHVADHLDQHSRKSQIGRPENQAWLKSDVPMVWIVKGHHPQSRAGDEKTQPSGQGPGENCANDDSEDSDQREWPELNSAQKEIREKCADRKEQSAGIAEPPTRGTSLRTAQKKRFR